MVVPELPASSVALGDCKPNSPSPVMKTLRGPDFNLDTQSAQAAQGALTILAAGEVPQFRPPPGNRRQHGVSVGNRLVARTWNGTAQGRSGLD